MTAFHCQGPLLRVLDAEQENWKTQAACRGLDPDIWFPRCQSQARFGKRICANCPVKQDCLDAALAIEEVYGTRGGLDQWERAKLLKKKWRHD